MILPQNLPAARGTTNFSRYHLSKQIHFLPRQLLLEGIGPSGHRKARQAESYAAAANSFETVAREWCATKRGGRSDSYRKRTSRLLEHGLFPCLGGLSVADIKPPERLTVSKRIGGRGAIETAKRAGQTAGLLFRFAIAGCQAANNLAAVVGDQLQPVRKNHFAMVTTPASC